MDTIGKYAIAEDCTDHHYIDLQCIWCSNIKEAEAPCEHKELEDNICIACHEEVQIFSEDINIFVRDLAPDANLNNFNFVTNQLPLRWRHVLVEAVRANNYKFINRTIIKTLPTDMIKKYILPKIPKSENKNICRKCGMLYNPNKAYLHKNCQKDRSDAIV